MSERFPIQCPDCGGKIVVDATTGSIVEHHSAAPATSPRADFDTLLAGLDTDRSHAEARFAQELEAHKNRDQILEERFETARRRAEAQGDLGQRPERPWDFD